MEETFLKIACTCSFQDRFVFVNTFNFVMICLVDFGAIYMNVHCINRLETVIFDAR